MQFEPKTFRLISLGCPKNLIDSEVMAGSLLAAGWRIVPEGPAQVCIVNTCSFVEDAAQESVGALLEAAETRENGEYELLIAAGCLPEKYRAEVRRAIPGVDAEIGTEDFPRIVRIVEDLLKGEGERVFLSPPRFLYDEKTPRALSGPPWRAYLKLAEGCDNRCSYCLIPSLRGSFRSRDFDSVIAEAHNLADMGVRELNLVAQDVTHYGADTGGPGLAKLLRELDRIEPLRWVRLLYAHPAHLTAEMLEAMAGATRVAPYLDLPIQHASDAILGRMNRKTDLAHIERLLDEAQRLMPDLVLRTTFIVGLPDETDEDFSRLLGFVQRRRFANVGAFVYSPEEGTPAFSMKPEVPKETAEARYDELMAAQQQIAAEIWQGMVGKTVEVLVEEELFAEDESDYTHAGRFYGQAPDIDGVTFCRLDPKARPGAFVNVRIVDSSEYDLFGEQLS